MELCEFCEMGELKLVEANPPWTTTHFQCPVCDSTYSAEIEIEFEMDDALLAQLD